MAPNRIVRRVVEAFRVLEERLRKEDFRESNVGWTREVLTALCTLGQDLGYKVGASHVRTELRDWGEWLYDVHWAEYDEDGWLRELALVAESEWGNLAAIDVDFQKLLVARATVRVFVYEGRKIDGGAIGVANKLTEYVSAFQGRRGDTYVLVAYEETDAPWSFRFFEILASEPGHRAVMRELDGRA